VWLGQGIEMTRTLAVELRPPVLEGESLPTMLRWLVGQMHELHGLTVALQAGRSPRALDAAVRVLLFQIVRELLFNVVKHAGVDRATVDLRAVDGHVEVEVADEGSGFDVAVSEHEEGFGLFTVRKRLEMLGGHLEIASVPGEGTRVTLFAPLERAPGEGSDHGGGG
jgi:signal transduction histidine kinase